MKKRYFWGIIAVIVILNMLAWVVFARNDSAEQLKKNRAAHPLLSPRVFVENPNDILINFVPLRKQLEKKFSGLPEGTQYSFYFEYLPSGTSMRIGDDNELIAASLIKVPLVMNLYRAAELGKTSLDRTITLTESDLDGTYGSLWEKGAGTKLTLHQLARLALEESDNTAAHAIYSHIDGMLEESDQSLAQLDIDQNLQNGQAIINAKSYASVLKSLYYASYVSRQSSNEILTYLTHSTEHERLTKKLPSTVKVAHKNGVYNQVWSESDCGIVYAPKRPYALCIMLGLPEHESNTFMADVSKQIFDYVTGAK